MKKTLLSILITLLFFIIGYYGLAKDKKISGVGDSYWKIARMLWQRYSENPTNENCQLFYDYLQRARDENQKQDMAWLLDDDRFKIEIVSGNKLIALAGLRLSLFAQEEQAREIISEVGRLSRINPELFLVILKESDEFMGEKFSQVVVTLPEEYEYLLSKADDFKTYSSLFSYFYCHELKKRHEAISSVKEKNTNKVREICLRELTKIISEHQGCQGIEVSDQLIAEKIMAILKLPKILKSRIFDSTLKRDRRNFILMIDYHYVVIWPILHYEGHLGNWKVLEETVPYVSSWLYTEILWELARIKPELFLRFLQYQENNAAKASERINFLESYPLRNLTPRVKIYELNIRIKGLRKIRDKQLREIRNRYIKILKDLKDKEEERLKLKAGKKPKRRF